MSEAATLSTITQVREFDRRRQLDLNARYSEWPLDRQLAQYGYGQRRVLVPAQRVGA